jgi:hypothetical protein
MATQRLSRLHKRILQWLVADHQRTKGFIGSPGIPVGTRQISLPRQAKPLEIFGRPLNDVLFSREFRESRFILSSHEELVKALQRDKGTISRSLRTLEARGWIVIGRSPGGKAQHLTLTQEGHRRATEGFCRKFRF